MDLRLRDDAVIKNIDGELVVVTKNGDAAVLNETAGFILQELLKQNDVEKTVGKLVAAFDIDELAAKRDLQAILEDFLKKDLLQAG
jgi:hypothetical protein